MPKKPLRAQNRFHRNFFFFFFFFLLVYTELLATVKEIPNKKYYGVPSQCDSCFEQCSVTSSRVDSPQWKWSLAKSLNNPSFLKRICPTCLRLADPSCVPFLSISTLTVPFQTVGIWFNLYGYYVDLYLGKEEGLGSVGHFAQNLFGSSVHAQSEA